MPGKTKNQRNFYAGSFGGRGWISRAALLKTAHWAVFAPSSATSSQLFESTRPMSLALSQNKNLSVLAYVEVFWWARVDSNHRSWKQQIYSLSPLATREHAHIHFLCPSPDDLLILSWRKAFVNCFLRFSSNAFSVQRNAWAKAGKALQPCGHGKVGEKANRKKLIGKLQEKLGTICEKCKTFLSLHWKTQ